MTRILLIVDYIPLRTMLGFFSIRRRFFNNFFLNNKKSKNRKILKNIFSYSFLFFQFQWIFSLLTIPKNQGKKFSKMKLLNFFSSRGMFLFSEIFFKIHFLHSKWSERYFDFLRSSIYFKTKPSKFSPDLYWLDFLLLGIELV